MKTRYFLSGIAALLLLPVVPAFSQGSPSGGIETKRAPYKDSLRTETPSFLSARALDNPPPLDVNVFPVPAKDRVSFRFGSSELTDIRVEIYELTGKQVVVFRPETMLYSLDLSDFNKGIYFYKVFRKESLVLGDKFIVTKE